MIPNHNPDTGIASPFITETARECSPCVPWAGDLDQVGEGSYQCYDVPPDWRADHDER